MLTPRLKAFLENHHVAYSAMLHRPAYTAMEVAQALHVPGQDMAKTVIVDLDGQLAMAVLPGTRHVSLAKLEHATGAQHARIAREGEFRFDFPDCEVGAMPPFGNLFNMEVLVDPQLAKDKEIVFNGGDHTEAVRMSYQDFARLVHPRIMEM
jgi:Ala-tRNA(Pro) deacylase